MTKYSAVAFILLFSFSISLADTFTHRKSGKTFNGYIVSGRKKGSKTQVRISNRSPKYLSLSKYAISQNALGRKNMVHIFPISNSINLITQAQAFEKAIAIAADHGPLFILITIDATGMQFDTAQRICSAIAEIDNCETIAFINGDKIGGAFAEAAIIALSCDRVFMLQGTAIGASDSAEQKASNRSAQRGGSTSQLTWKYFSSQIAKLKNRPVAIVKAMQDETIELIEVIEDGNSVLIDSRNKTPAQKISRTISEKGQLLRLTSAQALQYGIADAVVASESELFTSLDAAKSKKVRSNRLLKAKRIFERISRTMDRIMSFIVPLEDRAAAIDTEFEIVQKEINRLNDTIVRGYFGVNQRNILAGADRGLMQVYRLENLMIYRNELLIEWLDVLSELVRNYRKAIPLAEKHPDLNQNPETLRKNMESAEAKFEELQIGIRTSY